MYIPCADSSLHDRDIGQRVKKSTGNYTVLALGTVVCIDMV